MLPTFSLSDIRSKISRKISGKVATTDLTSIINDAVKVVFTDVDLTTAKRRVSLSLNGANTVISESVMGRPGTADAAVILSEESRYSFHSPDDLNGDALVDIRRRSEKSVQYELTDPETFLLNRNGFNNLMAVDESGSVKILLANDIDAISNIIVHNCDTVAGNGTWTADGAQVTAVAAVVDNYVEGAGALGLTTVSGVMAGGTITNSNLTAVDLSDYSEGSLYLWVYIPMATGITSFTLKWGSDASNYFSRVVTKTHDDVVFSKGWNLLRFPAIDATETGTVVDTAIDYLQLTIIKTAANTGTTGWIIDRIIACADSKHDVIYYSKFGWQTTAGVYMEDSTADTDLVNVDSRGLKLILLKASEYGSEFIGDDKGEAKYAQQYVDQKRDYGIETPSERKLITNSYQDFESTNPSVTVEVR